MDNENEMFMDESINYSSSHNNSLTIDDDSSSSYHHKPPRVRRRRQTIYQPNTNSLLNVSGDDLADWSKQSCEQFFTPLESFLDVQLRRERSSKRRCKVRR